MTESYALYLQTNSDARTVLGQLFTSDKIGLIENSEIFFLRGPVFLAHARQCGIADKAYNQILAAFQLSPTVSILFFPNGVSSFQTALDHLLEALLRGLHNTPDDLLLVANHKIRVLQRSGGHIRLNANQTFWRNGRLTRFDLPYEADT